MATFKKFNKDKRPKRPAQNLLFKRKRFCRFTVAGVEKSTTKDIDTLRDFIAETADHSRPPDRHPRDLPAPAQHRHQACPLSGIVALQRPAQDLRRTDHANHSSRKGS